jgi:hypothetical protein
MTVARKKSAKANTIVLLLILSFLSSLFPLQIASGISVSSTSAVLYVGKLEAFSDYGDFKLAMAPYQIEDEIYLPASAFRQLFRWKVVMLKKNERYLVASPDITIQLDLVSGKYLLEGLEYDLKESARLEKGILILQLNAMIKWFDLDYRFDQEYQRINLTYLPKPADEEWIPVARFYTTKSVYKVGERIEYFDVSYSPTEQNIASVQWSGKRDVFFEPGDKPVKLRVTDKGGQQSRWFTKIIRIVPEVLNSRFQYHVYSEDVGKSMAFPTPELRRAMLNLPKLEGLSPSSETRKLLISNSPETFNTPGMLYSDTIAGKVRLYASHVNGSEERMMFIVMATNPGAQEVKVTMTRKGEIIPSMYAQLNGRQGVLEYMIDRSPPTTHVVPAGATVMLAKMPTLRPKKGVNVIYDMETEADQAIKYSAIAVPVTVNLRSLMAENLSSLIQLPYDKHVRGTFAVAGKSMQITGDALDQPKTLSISDGESDPSLVGVDASNGQQALNPGSYGVMYKVDIERPPAMTVMMRARGGSFKGHFQINDRIVLAPDSGSLRPQNGLFVLARTKGNEPQLTIEFSPPAGSSLPIDLIFLPHANGIGLY